MSIYSRYLLGQIARPMITTILVALIALLAERTLRVVDLVVGWRGSLFVVFEMLGYLVPHYMGLALPVAFFIGILLTFSRLSREGELAAMHASGAGLARLVRPILIASFLLAAVTAFLVSQLQPYGRYAYRAATFALTNASFTTLLQSGLFTTVRDTTYMVEDLSEDKTAMRKVFIHRGKPGDDALTVTAVEGRVERSGPVSPIVLVLRNGLQLLVPAGSKEKASGADEGRPREIVARFRSFDTTFGNPDEAFRPRGEDEREMTLLELWTARNDPPPGVKPWEIRAELNGRLVRILALPVLPFMAIPLALGRVRAQRSYGLVVGLAVLIAFNQVIQLGESLADNNRLPCWLALWVPFSIFALGSLVAFVRTATRVPDPRFAFWLDYQLGRLRSLLPQRRGPAAAARG
ncbi:LptF/LptG family permease [Benzoatithermus flavus]|uniref:LptF/LptG family permease n=1 Tax=Benzoatithermus flavus TaxID=3108223 RepID=A0ABU8XTY0_9PROT